MQINSVVRPKTYLRSIIGTALLNLALASVLYAQEADKVSLFDLPLQEVLSIGVSTASKLEVDPNLSPGNITVITQEDIARYGYRNVGEALNSVPGFFHVDLGFDSNLALRGVANTKFTLSARVLFLMDGKRVNDFSYDQAFINDVLPLDIESVDRIEVLKGAGSVVWGSNAIYGVVNVISKGGSSKISKKLMTEIGSHNQRKQYASWGDDTKGGGKYHVALAHIEQNGTLKSYSPAFDTPDKNNGIAKGDKDYTILSSNLKFEYENFFFDGVGNLYKSQIDTQALQNFESEGPGDFIFDQGMFQSGYTFKLDKETDSKLLVRGFHTHSRYLNENRFPEGPDTTNEFIDHYRIYEKYAGAEIRYSQNLSESIKGTAGFEWIHVYDARESYRARLYDANGAFLELAPDPFSADRDRTMKSAFFDLNYQQSKQLGYFLGGRLDYASNLDSVFAPRAAAVYNPVDPTVFKLLYSEGFRNPGISESKILESNPQNLEAESVRTYEALWEQHIDKESIFKTSFFYNDLSDSIGVFQKDALYEYYTNFKGFRSKGVEFELRGKYNEMIRGYSSVMFAHASDKDDGSRLKTSPNYLARIGISFGYKDAYFLSPELILAGSSTVPSSEDPNEKEFDAFSLVNLTLMSYPLNKNLRVSSSIYNIGNDRYVTYAGRGHAMESGREYRLNLSWEF